MDKNLSSSVVRKHVIRLLPKRQCRNITPTKSRHSGKTFSLQIPGPEAKASLGLRRVEQENKPCLSAGWRERKGGRRGYRDRDCETERKRSERQRQGDKKMNML